VVSPVQGVSMRPPADPTVDPRCSGSQDRILGTVTSDSSSDSRKIYWADFVQQLRRELGWSQGRLAEALRTDQTTVSRWERSLMLPRMSMRGELETLAAKAGLLTLSQVAGFVKASPFPVILVDQTGQVVAASSASGFVEGRGVKEQTPVDQHETLARFKAGLSASGFWSREPAQAHYHHDSTDGLREAVATPISIRGQVFTLVQKKHIALG